MVRKHGAGAVHQSLPKNGVGEIRARFGETADSKSMRHGTAAKAPYLRKDVPHPMRALPTFAELGESASIAPGLGLHEAL